MKARQNYFLMVFLVCLMCQAGAMADDLVQVGLIYYRLDDTDMTAEVMPAPFVYDEDGNIKKSGYYDEVYKDWNDCSLNFFFYDDTVEYNGKKYKITKIGNKALAYLNWPNFEYHKYLGDYISEEVPVRIKLPESITCIGDSAFFHSTAIGIFPLPSGIKSFGKDVFVGSKMSGLTIQFPEIPERLFHDCTIDKVWMLDSVRTIGKEAFADCSIEYLEMRGVREIKENAFAGVTGLTEIWIDCDTPPATAPDAFGAERSSPVFSATLHIFQQDHVDYYRTTEPWSWFSDIQANEVGTLIDGIYYQLDPLYGTAKVSVKDLYAVQTGSLGYYTGSISIPENLIYDGEEYMVTEVGEWAFANCSDIESVSLPCSIRRIGEYAFYNAKGVPKYPYPPFTLKLPDSLQSIGTGAFKSARIRELRIPSCVRNLPDYAFCESDIRKLILPDGIENIGAYALADCQRLGNLALPKTIKDIGDKAFYGTGCYLWICCDNPPTIASDAMTGYQASSGEWRGVIEGITELYVFEKDLEYYKSTEPWSKFEIIPGMDELSPDHFNRNYRPSNNDILYFINKLEYQASVTSGWNHNDKSVDSGYYQGDIVVPDAIVFDDYFYKDYIYDVVGVEPEAFMDATALTSVSLPEGLVWVGRKAFARSGVRHVDWPKSVAEVADSMFLGSELREIALPEGVTTLKESAMAMCKSLASVTLPSTLTEIGAKAFAGSRIEEITLYNEEVPETSPDAFGKDPDDRFWDIYAATVRVPQGCAWKYEQTEPWCNFLYIEEMEESSVENLAGDNDGTEVYTLDGRRVSAADFSDGSLPHGVYVVRSAGKVRKVLRSVNLN